MFMKYSQIERRTLLRPINNMTPFLREVHSIILSSAEVQTYPHKFGQTIVVLKEHLHPLHSLATSMNTVSILQLQSNKREQEVRLSVMRGAQRNRYPRRV